MKFFVVYDKKIKGDCMPLYEYRCLKCNKINTFLEKTQQKKLLWFSRDKKACTYCGSKKLEKIISNFAVSAKQGYADMLNDISKMGPVNFVPDYRMPGPPPGGCPYAKQAESPSSKPA